MIELTDHQLQSLETPVGVPLRVVNPRTQEVFVLLRSDEYERLKAAEYDDSPLTREELQSFAWEAGRSIGWDGMTEYDNAPVTP